MFNVGDKVVFKKEYEYYASGVYEIVRIKNKEDGLQALAWISKDGREDGGYYLRRFMKHKKNNTMYY